MSKLRDVVVVRVSEKGDREDEHFHSPEVQIEAARRWATDRGERLVASPIPEIDVSGRLPLFKRPGLLAAIEMIEAGQPDELSVGPHFGSISTDGLGPLPITADIVDANAAMFAQGCLHTDIIKATYGTGAFVATNVGHALVLPTNGLLPFVAWQVDARTSYAVEGGVFDVGTAIDWLVDAGLVATPEATADVAGAIDSHGVVMVPSFSGLAAPRWQPSARAAIRGITLDTKPRHLVRAVLEGIACSVAEIVLAIEDSTGTSAVEIRADGGPSRNTLLMQLQADLLGRPIAVSREHDLTAFGAALLAGVGAGALTVTDTQSLAPPRFVYDHV